MPRKGPGRIGAAKIRDADYLEWLCATLKEGCLTASMIQSLAWEKFRHRGVKREGTGGAIRRLLQQKCASCKWFRGPDLFARGGGFWTVKGNEAALPVEVQASKAA